MKNKAFGGKRPSDSACPNMTGTSDTALGTDTGASRLQDLNSLQAETGTATRGSAVGGRLLSAEQRRGILCQHGGPLQICTGCLHGSRGAVKMGSEALWDAIGRLSVWGQGWGLAAARRCAPGLAAAPQLLRAGTWQLHEGGPRD